MANANRGLGKGLGALLGDAALRTDTSDNLYLPISQIEPYANQPRRHFDEEALQDLADSIREHGIIQPLTVRRLSSGYYQIIAGERRWRAARIAGLAEVPAIVIEADDRKMTELSLIENLQREDLDPIEEAEGYKTLMDNYHLTQEEAAERVGKSRSAVANSLRLLGLCPEVRQMLQNGELSGGHARALLPLKADLQLDAANLIVKQGLSVRQTEALAKRLSNPKEERKPTNDELIAESYDLMRRGLGMTPAEIGDVFEEWNKTELDSYLIEITAEVLHQVDKKTGKPLVDLIVDHAGMKGTGTWTVQTALSLAVPVTGIAEAVFARGLSSEADLREEAQKQGFAGPDGKLNLNDDEKKAFIEDIRQALYASKIVAYAQGFNEITTAAKEYGWDIDLAAVARIWRGGCIIRAKFLNRISEAFESGEANVSLLFAPYFKNAIENAEKSWRNVVAQAAVNGLPTPAFASSLSYFDGLRSKRLPAALIQGQRDYFGAHTYQRVDQPGAFHTLWAEPGREEIEA